MNHILLGPEEGLKAAWLDEEKNRILSEHPDAEIHTLFVGDDKGEDLEAILSQPSLFSSFRLAIIKQYENRTGKDTFDKALIDFLASKDSDAEFIILSTEKSKSKLSQKIASDSNVEIRFFWEMFERDKRDWIRTAFSKEGFRISENGISEVLFTVENNTADMRNLVTALSIFFHATAPSKKEITDDDIASYAQQTRGEDGNTLFQAIAEKDLGRAETILSAIIGSDTQAPIRAFSTISQRFRQLESFEMLKQRGMTEKEAFENADSLSPYTVFYPTKGIKGRDQAVFRKAAASYPLQTVRKIIIYLGRMDDKVKNSSTEWLHPILSSILATIILRGGVETELSLSDLSLG